MEVDDDTFAVTSQRVLKEGGYFIYMFASKFAPFALIKLMPEEAAKVLLNLINPTSGRPGFPAFYDKYYNLAIKALFEENELETASTWSGYYQSRYFGLFLPLFSISALYEILLHAAKPQT